jgi:hypothetical protein
MLKGHNIDQEINGFLIEKVVASLCVRRARGLGYAIVGQKIHDREK